MNPSCLSLNSVRGAYVVLHLFHAQEVPCAHAWLLSCVQFFATPQTVACWPLCPWDSPGKKTGVGSHSLLQGIFPAQGLNPGLSPALQADSLPLSHL